jgi:two-component system CheB/CheR fusion protein
MVGYGNLIADTQSVLDTLILKEISVQTIAGRWYTMRIQPYRTLDNVIEGAVISFIDITETVRARDALYKANELLRLAVVVRDAHDGITMQDLQGRILAWNPGATRMYGWSETEALLMNTRDRIPPGIQKESMEHLIKLSQAQILEPFRSERIDKEGKKIAVMITSTALMNDAGEMYAIATTERAVGSGQ